ncbi:MAG: TIGR02452 family protein, partial [Bacillota bacterium]|nr:TIGR02452 family protein [Bacillota bacterium]
DQPKVNRALKYIVTKNIINCGSITALHNLRDKGLNGEIIILNFANAMFPGGAYIIGGNAQEESLCRASMLYYSLKYGKHYYNYNRMHIMPTYSDIMIYSQDIPVIRNDDGVLLKNPATCSFITSPAVNRRFAKFFYSSSKINEIMDNRIRNIICLTAQKKPKAVILGAFGCGVFANKREFVYSTFEKYINMYIDDEIQVIFAVK